MKRKSLFLISMMFIFVFSASTSMAGGPPQVGSTLPDIKLQKPADAAELKYLGLSGSGEFTVAQIKAQAVILQVFSMYCPYCQKDAPNMNRLFGMIENNPTLKGKIKILGIGAGNTPFEVNTFKKRYKVVFPLVPDADFTIHKILGEVRTPYFIVVRMDGPKKPEVVYSKLGAHEDIEAFLSEVVALADMK
jgi:peroxiredoxin